MPSRKRPRVVCTCVKCKTKTFVNDLGEQKRGKRVCKSTRTNHRRLEQGTSIPTETAGSASEEGHDSEPSSVIGNPQSQGQQNTGSLRESLFIAVCALTAWLHLSCGLSIDATSRLLKALNLILQAAVELGRLVAMQSRKPEASRPFHIPGDVRTAISKLSLEPKIIRSICCPKCFTPYALEDLPQKCLNQQSARSKTCGEKLWTTRSTRGGPRRVPRRLYSTQDFESWLEYFLSRPGIEDIIDESYNHTPTPENMQSIWDSPAWQDLEGNFSTTPGNLTFSYYIDWFNPLTNKISGKTVSCGAIMMFCLNLPHDIQHLPENTFFAGITPPPKEPTVVTITALSDPIIEKLKPMWEGRVVKTHRHPRGIKKRVAILARIGDAPAMRKALGFAAVTAKNFCSFCKLQYEKKDDLDWFHWGSREGSEVKLAASNWKNATTKAAQDEIFAEHGVRWSSLHGLPYGDPVKHTLLGLMHNWYEGVLQHHFRVLWGIGVAASHNQDLDEGQADDSEEEDAYLGEGSPEELLLAEIDDIYQESQTYMGTPAHLARLRTESVVLNSAPTSTAIPLLTVEGDMVYDIDEDVDYRPTPDPDLIGEGAGSPTFTSEEISRIRDCLSETVIPSWVDRPPTDIGEKSHGKLKADQWFVLFSVFLPLILPEIWHMSPNNRHQALLHNFHSLVFCTNIVSAYRVTPSDPGTYLSHYLDYRRSSKALFPNISPRPNHHFAMHNVEKMQFWGPLIRLSEFPGERHNGNLQKIKTNNHLWEMDFTMLRQICRRGRIMAFLRTPGPTSLVQPKNLLEAMSFLFRKSEKKADPNSLGLKQVPMPLYLSILTYINEKLPIHHRLRHVQDLPHPEGSVVLSRWATPIGNFEYKSRSYSTFARHRGNSSVHFEPEFGQGIDLGHIESAWHFSDIRGTSRTFLEISVHRPLSSQDEQRHPYDELPGFFAKVAYTRRPDQLTLAIRESTDILGHVAYYDRPPGTFGINTGTTVLIRSLQRNRV